MINGVSYNKIPGSFAAVDAGLLDKMADLYSNHYKKKKKKGIHPGNNIRLSQDKLKDWLNNEDVTLYYALLEDKYLVGYAIAFSKKEKNYGIITWVTQLVVHKEHRNKGIAKRLLFSIWGFSDHFAWGIVSANPYAIRALEKATRRRAKTIRIKRNARKLLGVGKENVPFINEDTKVCVDKEKSVIDTGFFVDHSDTLEMLKNVTSDDLPWELGYIEEGWEWFAFTFNDQPQIKLSKEEILMMIDTADEVVKTAYERMMGNDQSENQKWAKYTSEEIAYLDEIIGLDHISNAYDLGCGTGRHSIELAKKGIGVLGIDYVSQTVKKANEVIDSLKHAGDLTLNNIQIIEADCRYYENEKKADLVLCLYDVVGSFASDDDNKSIIRTAFNLLSDNGYAVFSVMNYTLTLDIAVHKFKFDENPSVLLELLPSSIMETSGNIFDPNYYYVDTNTRLVYRKERFSKGFDLPVELIVRDRRFTIDEIVEMCREEGFDIVEAKHTKASCWHDEFPAHSKSAKEILVICHKPVQ